MKFAKRQSYLTDNESIILVQEKNIRRLNEVVRHLQQQLQQCRSSNDTRNGTVSLDTWWIDSSANFKEGVQHSDLDGQTYGDLHCLLFRIKAEMLLRVAKTPMPTDI
ncbi:hypothetical protein MTR_4g052250 [Medicago truncatula]|uniref:Uncharacterized protein n=1 Tax=Medicago truncatula TaxID=3880 RepID=A0A072UK91_MEDTR|nr:hypothetical protein MTR_4g052250 [Medicago truncatula]